MEGDVRCPLSGSAPYILRQALLLEAKAFSQPPSLKHSAPTPTWHLLRCQGPELCSSHLHNTYFIHRAISSTLFLSHFRNFFMVHYCVCAHIRRRQSEDMWLGALLSPLCGLRGGQTRVAGLAEQPLYLLGHLPSPLSVVFIKVEESRKTEPEDTGELTLHTPPCLLFSLHMAMTRNEHSGFPCRLVQPHPRFLRCSEVWVN